MSRKTIGVFFLLGIVVLGGWLVLRPADLQPETVSRQQSLLQAFAPTGGGAGQVNGPVETGQRTVSAPVTPVVRYLSDVKITTEQPDSMYNRWLRGELDLDENDGILSNVEMQALREEALRMPPSPNVQLATSRPLPQAPISAGLSFASLDFNDGGGSVPPDPEMAAGPNHVIATVNVAVAIYDKTTGTAVLGPTSAGSLFSNAPCTGGLYDPNVIYDEEAERWFLAYDQGPQAATGGYCVLVSQTSDPITGGWYEYFFQTNDSSVWMDYPHAGVGDNYIFMGANLFNLPGINNGNFVEGRLYAFSKADLYAGNAVTMIEQGLGASIDTPQPLNLHGASNGTWPSFGDTHYFLGEPYDGANYTMLEWDTSTLTNHGNINLGTGGMPVASDQSGSTANLRGNDFRPQDFEYRDGYGWTAMTISCNPGSGTVNCIRWAQIDLSSSTPPTLGPAGSGVFSSNGDYRSFPDLAVNRCGDMAIGYTKTSASSFPGVWVTGRESGDAPNTLQAESLVKAGEIAYTAFDGSPHRWGDYTGMTIDPDGSTFWYLGEYSKDTGTTSGRWGTWIASFEFEACGATPSFTQETTPTTQSICLPSTASYTVSLTGTSGAAGNVNLTTAGAPGTPAFSPNPVTLDGSSNLTLSGVAAGNYTFDVVGTHAVTTTLVQTNTVMLDVFAGVPGTPTLNNPADTATGVGYTPTFDWTAVANADSYHLQVSTDSGFGSTVISTTVATNSYTPGSPLSPNTTYYWRVTANNGCGAGLTAEASEFTTAVGTLVCNSGPIDFESGIPLDWSVTDDSAGGDGLIWETTADAACTINNLTNGTGVAACADSDGAGSGAPAYDTSLVSNPFDLTGYAPITLTMNAHYRDLNAGSNDFFNVDYWDGATWITLVDWDEDHRPEDIAVALPATATQIRVRYAGNGYDWYAQVDNVALSCEVDDNPVITVAPTELTSGQTADQQLTQTLTISNTGLSPLNWTLAEAPALMTMAAGDHPIDAKQAPAIVGRSAPRYLAPAATLLDEGFEGGSVPPSGWTEEITNAGYNWKVQTTGTPHSGTVAADVAYDPGLNNQDEWLVGPEMNLTDGTLSFWSLGSVFWCRDDNDNCDLDVYLVVGAVGGGDDIYVGTADADWTASYTWSQSSFDLTPLLPGGPVKIAFNYTGNDGAQIALDDILVTEPDPPPACEVPSDLGWASLSQTSGTTNIGSSSMIDVTFDSGGLATGVYSGTLCVNSNDPAMPLVSVPLTMTVCALPPAVANLTISNTVSAVNLSWDNAGVDYYEVWWGINDFFFMPGADCSAASNCTTETGPFHSRAGAAGNSDDNYTFVVIAVDMCGTSSLGSPMSSRQAEFDFSVTPGN